MDYLTQTAVETAITGIVGGIVSLAIGYAVYLFQQYTGIKIAQVNIDKLKGAAATEAGALVAAEIDNLKNASVTKSDPAVATAADAIAARNPDAVKATGVTRDTLRQYVVGEIGKLQAKGESK